MNIKSEHGAAMVTTFMVIVVLTLLGVALWQYQMVDALQVTRDQNSMQAHYLARTGAEVGIKTVLDNPGRIGQGGYASITERSLDNVGTFCVDFETPVIDGPGDVRLHVRGRTNEVEERISVIIMYNDDGIVQRPSEWFAGNSHIIKHQATDFSYADRTVELFSLGNQVLRSPSAQDTTLRAAVLLFTLNNEEQTQEYSFEVTQQQEAVTLHALFMSFDGKLRYRYNNDSTSNALVFRVPGFRDTDKNGGMQAQSLESPQELEDDHGFFVNDDSGGDQHPFFCDLLNHDEFNYNNKNPYQDGEYGKMKAGEFYGVAYFEDGMFYNQDAEPLLKGAQHEDYTGYYFFKDGARLDRSVTSMSDFTDDFIPVPQEHVDLLMKYLRSRLSQTQVYYEKP